MAKYRVKTFNTISPLGLSELPKDSYEVSDAQPKPDAIILRSHKLQTSEVADSVVAVARAGAGVNNIPVEALTKRGIVVFNAPGANANAVKELVLSGMLLASRHIVDAANYVKGLRGSNDDLAKLVEDGKKKFKGYELAGKTLGVIGMGAIGYRVANLAIDLGMHVVGYDPAMTVKNAWQVSSEVEQVEDIDDVLKRSNVVTLHVPLLAGTKDLIDMHKLEVMKSDAVLLNFSRDKIVDEKGVIAALDSNKLGVYVTDFPNNTTYQHPKVIALPHLGASTEEAEDLCAVMVAQQLRDFLENGNIRNAVNFPHLHMKRASGVRLTVAHANEPGMLNQLTSSIASHNLNVAAIINKNLGEQAYTMIDIDAKSISQELTQEIQDINHVQRVRIL